MAIYVNIFICRLSSVHGIRVFVCFQTKLVSKSILCVFRDFSGLNYSLSIQLESIDVFNQFCTTLQLLCLFILQRLCLSIVLHPFSDTGCGI